MASKSNSLTVEELNEVMQLEETPTELQQAQLIVYNDDFNTFDWVIQCFFDKLKPMKDALVERGLSAVIDNMVIR